MQINVTYIGPTQGQHKSSVLATATAEITLSNGDQVDKIVISNLQVIKDADADILWVASQASASPMDVGRRLSPRRRGCVGGSKTKC